MYDNVSPKSWANQQILNRLEKLLTDYFNSDDLVTKVYQWFSLLSASYTYCQII